MSLLPDYTELKMCVYTAKMTVVSPKYLVTCDYFSHPNFKSCACTKFNGRLVKFTHFQHNVDG